MKEPNVYIIVFRKNLAILEILSFKKKIIIIKK